MHTAARYEKVPADKLIGTIILERIIDAITLLSIFAITLAFTHLYTDLINAFFHSPRDPVKERISVTDCRYSSWNYHSGYLLWMLIKRKVLMT
jgi:hypothetical protein